MREIYLSVKYCKSNRALYLRKFNNREISSWNKMPESFIKSQELAWFWKIFRFHILKNLLNIKVKMLLSPGSCCAFNFKQSLKHIWNSYISDETPNINWDSYYFCNRYQFSSRRIYTKSPCGSKIHSSPRTFEHTFYYLQILIFHPIILSRGGLLFKGKTNVGMIHKWEGGW